MKKFSFVFLLLLLFVSCSDKNSDLKVEIQDVYPFEIDNGYELNLNAKVEGFEQEKANDEYKFDLKYNVDIENSSGKVIEGIIKGTVSEKSEEIPTDFIIESQAQLDSTYQEGEYKIIILVEDLNSNKKAEAEKIFELGF